MVRMKEKGESVAGDEEINADVGSHDH